MLDDIKQLCIAAKTQGAWSINIYYTGHGIENVKTKQRGPWLLRNGQTLSANDILPIIEQHWGHDKVFFYLDCCFSGQWLFDIKNYINKNKSKLCHVNVYAASYYNEPAIDTPMLGGEFKYNRFVIEQKKYDINHRRCSGVIMESNQVQLPLSINDHHPVMIRYMYLKNGKQVFKYIYQNQQSVKH